MNTETIKSDDGAQETESTPTNKTVEDTSRPNEKAKELKPTKLKQPKDPSRSQGPDPEPKPISKKRKNKQEEIEKNKRKWNEFFRQKE